MPPLNYAPNAIKPFEIESLAVRRLNLRSSSAALGAQRRRIGPAHRLSHGNARQDDESNGSKIDNCGASARTGRGTTERKAQIQPQEARTFASNEPPSAFDSQCVDSRCGRTGAAVLRGCRRLSHRWITRSQLCCFSSCLALRLQGVYRQAAQRLIKDPASKF